MISVISVTYVTESAEGGEGGLECHGCEVVFARTKWDYRLILIENQ